MPRKSNKTHIGCVSFNGNTYAYSLDRNGRIEVHRHAETVLTFNVDYNHVPDIKDEILKRLKIKIEGARLHSYQIIKVPVKYIVYEEDYNQDIYPDY